MYYYFYLIFKILEQINLILKWIFTLTFFFIKIKEFLSYGEGKKEKLFTNYETNMHDEWTKEPNKRKTKIELR